MAASGVLRTALAAVKAHAAAATVAGVVVITGGIAAGAVATGAIHLPGQSNAQHNNHDENSDRAKACADNGEAKRLAATYASMFDNSGQKAQDAICAIFVNKDGGHAIGLGEIRQALDIAATIESKGGSTACLTAAPVHGTSGDTGKPSDPGNPTNTGHSGSASTGSDNQSFTLTIPSGSTDDTNSLLKSILDARDHGTPLAQLAKSCAVPHGAEGGDTGSGKPQGTETPEGMVSVKD